MSNSNYINLTGQQVNEKLHKIEKLYGLGSHKISYDTIQSELTDDQKICARRNIGLNIEEKTESMTGAVGMDSDGKLWSESIPPYDPTFTNFRDLNIRIINNDMGNINVGDEIYVDRATSIIGYLPDVDIVVEDIEKFLSKTGAIKNSYSFIWVPSAQKWDYEGTLVYDLMEDFGINYPSGAEKESFSLTSITTEELCFTVLDKSYDVRAEDGYNNTLTLGINLQGLNFPFSPVEKFIIMTSDVAKGDNGYCFKANVSALLPDNEKGKYFSFNPTQSLKEGDYIILHSTDSSISGKTIDIYDKSNTKLGTTTLSAPQGTSPVTGCTNLGGFTRNITENPTNHMNSIDRAMYGNSKYADSLIRRYLNSNSKTEWIHPREDQGEFCMDATVSNLNGFLYGLDPEFKHIFTPVIRKNLYSIPPETSTVIGDIAEPVSLLSYDEIVSGSTGPDRSTNYNYTYFQNNEILTGWTRSTLNNSPRIVRLTTGPSEWASRSMSFNNRPIWIGVCLGNPNINGGN